MTKEKQLTQEIAELKAQYHDLVTGGAPRQDTWFLDDKIKAKQNELCDILSSGAKPCPVCGEKPIGMKVKSGVYEVGALGSILRARGETSEEAVENWNNGIYWSNPLIPGDKEKVDALVATLA